jgi:signal transduction histidine kinase
VHPVTQDRQRQRIDPDSAADLVGEEPENDQSSGNAEHPRDDVLHAGSRSKLKAVRRNDVPEPTAAWLADRLERIVADTLEELLLEPLVNADPPLTRMAIEGIVRDVTQAVRVVQEQTIEAFVAHCSESIQRQNIQLGSFGQLVAHEMRQPLSVLQVMPAVLPIREGDVELLRLVDMFDRNVRRLADVAVRLERLSHRGAGDKQ